MKIKYIQHFKQDRFAFAKDESTDRYCIAIPVFNGMVEYNEYYEISNQEYNEFSKDFLKAKLFVEKCRNQKEDARLMQKPGKMRGTPV